jgi:hypothetical protein
MDPVSVGSAAAVLLATSGGESLAGEAGKAAWAGLGRLVTLVRAKFADDRPAVQALEVAQGHPTDPAPVQRLAETLVQHGDRDPGFLQALAQLVEEARRDPVAGPALVQVNDYASIGRVVSIGTVHGNVSF